MLKDVGAAAPRCLGVELVTVSTLMEILAMCKVPPEVVQAFSVLEPDTTYETLPEMSLTPVFQASVPGLPMLLPRLHTPLKDVGAYEAYEAAFEADACAEELQG